MPKIITYFTKHLHKSAQVHRLHTLLLPAIVVHTMLCVSSVENCNMRVKVGVYDNI